jgi:hypothetical protein
MPNQTTIQNQKAIFDFDGYVVEVGATIGTLVNLGACNGDAIGVIKWEKFKQESANAGVLHDIIKSMSVDLTFDMFELDPTNLAALSNGVFTKEDIAGTPTAITGEALGTGWTIGQPIKLANKMGDNSTVTSIVIDADTTPLTVVTDYTSYVGDGSNGTLGYTYIVPVTAQAGVLDADYSYTPNAASKLHAGTSSLKLTPQIVRFSHTNTGGKVRSLTVYASKLGDAGFTFTFGSAESDGSQSFPMALVGDLDVTRDNGEQLLTWLDEQSV